MGLDPPLFNLVISTEAMHRIAEWRNLAKDLNEPPRATTTTFAAGFLGGRVLSKVFSNSSNELESSSLLKRLSNHASDTGSNTVPVIPNLFRDVLLPSTTPALRGLSSFLQPQRLIPIITAITTAKVVRYLDLTFSPFSIAEGKDNKHEGCQAAFLML